MNGEGEKKNEFKMFQTVKRTSNESGAYSDLIICKYEAQVQRPAPKQVFFKPNSEMNQSINNNLLKKI